MLPLFSLVPVRWFISAVAFQTRNVKLPYDACAFFDHRADWLDLPVYVK